MKFLVDECTGPTVAKWLIKKGHEVFSVYNDAQGMDDDKIFQKAFEENRILITNDKDFGEKIYKEKRPHKGVILLRLEDERSKSKIKILGKLFEKYEKELSDSFVVVTESKIPFSQSHNWYTSD